MITGTHVIIHTKDAEADRAFFRDVLRLPHVDVGDGWLIFGLPPSEVACHPAEGGERHEFYLMCDDVEEFVRAAVERGVACGATSDEGWGLLTHVTLPGGSRLGVYQPKHARPAPVQAGASAKSAKAARKARKKELRRAEKATRREAKKAEKAKRKAEKQARKASRDAAVSPSDG